MPALRRCSMVFSQAMVNHSHVSPKFVGSNNWIIGNVGEGEAGPEEDMINIGDEGEGEEGEMEEERKIKGKKIINQPTKEEYDDHMRTHIAFRKWCPFCVKGKRKNDPHRSSKDKEEQEVPTMSWDYEEQRGKKGVDGTLVDKGEDGRNKTLLGIDRENKWLSAIVVEKKGVNPYAVAAVGREIGNSGFNRILLKSDQEPALLKLLEAVKNERPEDIEMVPESPYC